MAAQVPTSNQPEVRELAQKECTSLLQETREDVAGGAVSCLPAQSVSVPRASLQSSLLTNPTGKGIRNDSQGQGHFGARRIKKDGTVGTHNGIDLMTTVGQEIVAPIDGRVRNFKGAQTKYPMLQIYPSTPNPNYDYIEILYVDAPYGVRAWTFRNISAGDPIGVAVSLQTLGYAAGVTPHVHVQMIKLVDGKKQFADPTSFFIKK